MSQDARPILNAVADQLQAAGIESARSDARLLLGLACGRAGPVLPHEDLAKWQPEDQAALDALVARRMRGEPVSRMRGWREFWSLRFTISPATLDPRPDSEILVEKAAAYAQSVAVPQPAILDLGTGSGCLLLAVLSEVTHAVGIGVDINPAAVTAAAANATALDLAARARFYHRSFAAPAGADWPDDLVAPAFDVILCNPPYIRRDDIASLAPDVAAYDPMLALDGGPDGLECWRELLPPLATLLSPDGRAFVEIGDGQRPDVVALATAAGLVEEAYYPDLSGAIRVLVFRAAHTGS